MGLEPLSADQIRLILDTAEPFKEVSERPIKKVPALRGKTIVNLFFEASTRTRISFEFAEKRLSADTVNVATAGSSVSKGETLVDTARNLEAMRIDMVVIRHGASGAAQFLGQRIRSQRDQRRRRQARAPDAGTARHPHAARPLQADRGAQGRHLRRHPAQPRGAQQHLGAAPSWAPRSACAARRRCCRATCTELGVTVLPRIEDAIQWADALNILRLQLERMQAGFLPSLREYNRVFGVTSERLARAPKDLLILHPGPMNRGVEIDSDVADGPHSVILPQVTNGVAVRMAVLYLLAGGSPDWAQPGRRRLTMRPILIRGGRVLDPSRNIDADRRPPAAGRQGRGARARTSGRPDGADGARRRRDRSWRPGLIDVHVHLREPGQEDVETIATGAMAAAAGGFTAVCAMPNTDPVTDNQAAVGFIVRQAQRAGKARVYPIGAISLGQKGQQLAEFGELVGAGAVAVSDDGKPVVSSHLMRTALEYARTFGIPVADHCEEPTLAAGGAMNEGLVSTRLGLKGVPAAAEEIMVARDILLAELTGGHVHLCHMSTRGSVELIRRAKEKGLRVTAEACPHHFTLTDEACEGYNTNAKMNPPLARARGPRGDPAGAARRHDRRDLHRPRAAPLRREGARVRRRAERHHRTGDRARPRDHRAGGRRAAGPADAGHPDEHDAGAHLQPAGRHAGAAARRPTWWCSTRPRSGRSSPTTFYSKSRNTPFAGRRLRGRADVTIVRGQVVFRRPGERDRARRVGGGTISHS